MTPQEEKDLAEFKRKRCEIQTMAFNSMRDTLRLSAEELKSIGYTTNEKAAIGVYLHAQKEVDRLLGEYISKYPA